MTPATALSDVLPGEALRAGGDDDRWSSLGGAPEAVVSPETSEEAASVLAWASAQGVCVVPAGSAARLGPERVLGPYIVLTSNRLCGLEIYEPADVTFTAGSGTPVAGLAEALGANRQWLPFDPPGMAERTLGGLVAAGDAGPLATGYGAIRNHVLGMTVVTGDGRVLALGGRVVKNVAGFDLLKPLVGSRGRLAFITSVCMRAFPVPAAERVLVLRADRAADLVAAAMAVGTAPVMPVSTVLTTTPGGATLAVRLHGAEATLAADRATLEAHAGVRFEVAGGEEGGPPRAEGGAADTVLVGSVIPSRLASALEAVEATSPARVAADTYGGRLRARLPRFDAAAVRELRVALERLGGALAVERAPRGVELAGVASEPTADERVLVAGVKRVFDPAGVLWRP